MPEKWITVKDAAQLRQCAERTIIQQIHDKQLEAKKDGRRWLILMDVPEKIAADMPQDADLIAILKAELQEKNDQIRQLQEQNTNLRQDAADASERHDTIVLNMTRQNQLMLEAKNTPWYRRMFGKKQKASDGMPGK